MDRIGRRRLIVAFGCGAALVAQAGVSAMPEEQAGPPVTGTIALEGTVDQTYKAANTVMVKTVDGVRHLFHLTGKTVVHGTEAAGTDALAGLENGSRVVVHYSAAAGEQTALEVDRVDDMGLKAIQGVVVHIDRAGREISLRLADGSTGVLRLTDRAATSVGDDVGRAVADTTHVIVYCTDEAGRHVAHYFKKIS